jgi:hypothetical protein
MKRVGIKWMLLCVLGLFVPTLVFAQTTSYGDAMKRVAYSIEGKLSGNSPIALLKFESSSERFSLRIINDLTELFINDNITVVDRQHMETILQEQNFQLSGYVSDESAVSIGYMLGAQSIIIGSGENMVDYYHLQFRMIGVESAIVQAQISLRVRYDSSMRRLLSTSGGSGIGNSHFLIGARLGAGFEINTADEDMVGSGYSPKEKSNTAFHAALYGAFKFNEKWSIQPEVNFMINNGMEISGQGYTVTIDYTTLDIPVLVRWNFIQSPLLVGVLAGPYISIPIGKLNLSVDDNGSALDTTGISGGATGGFAVAYKLGPGYITADIRFLHDFASLKVREDFGNGMQDAKIGIRRSINLTVGYEFSL